MNSDLKDDNDRNSQRCMSTYYVLSKFGAFSHLISITILLSSLLLREGVVCQGRGLRMGEAEGQVSRRERRGGEVALPNKEMGGRGAGVEGSRRSAVGERLGQVLRGPT